MKTLRSFLAAVALLGALCSAGLARAANYSISLDVAALIGNPAGPFYLSFQSIWGSGAPQSIAVHSFEVTGGGFVDGTEWSTGAVSGDINGGLFFSPDSLNFYNEFFQQFDAAVTQIKFDVTLSEEAAAGTPTSFSVSILDDVNLYPIPTNGFADTLVFANLDGRASNLAVAQATGDFEGAGAHVPDAGATGALVAGALLALGVARRFRRGAAAA